jgi:hypothetical protein
MEQESYFPEGCQKQLNFGQMVWVRFSPAKENNSSIRFRVRNIQQIAGLCDSWNLSAAC